MTRAEAFNIKMLQGLLVMLRLTVTEIKRDWSLNNPNYGNWIMTKLARHDDGYLVYFMHSTKCSKQEAGLQQLSTGGFLEVKATKKKAKYCVG